MVQADDDIKVPSSLKRNLGLLATVVAMLVVAPAITRVLSDYRAVVLQVEHDRMLTGLHGRPPKWVPRGLAEPGDMVIKNAGEWNVRVVEATGADRELLELYKRYVFSYEGVITAIRDAVVPGGAKVAVIEVEGRSKQLHVPLWSDKLAGAAPGRRVLKQRYTWEPSLLADGFDAPDEE